MFILCIILVLIFVIFIITALSLIMLLLFPGSFVDRGKSLLLTFIRAEKVLRNLMPKLILISNLPVSIVPVVTYSSFSVWK